MTKHLNPRAREIAEQGTILLTLAGSNLFGTGIGDGDRDELGIFIEPPECVIGLERRVDRFQLRTQPDGVRSGLGDIDRTIYSLRHWTGQVAQGNPSMLLTLFVPIEKWLVIPAPTRWGLSLQAEKGLFISKEAGRRFIGYLNAQREGVLGLRHTNRPELIEKHGVDVKHAYQVLRLGIQGVELLKTGHITLPMTPADQAFLKDVRTGTYTKDEILNRIDELRAELAELNEKVDLPDKPDYDKINDWLIEMHETWWAGCNSAS